MYIFKSKKVNALLMKCLKMPKEISEAVFRRTEWPKILAMVN